MSQQRRRLSEVQADNKQLSSICGTLQLEIEDLRTRQQSLVEARDATSTALQRLTDKHGMLQADYDDLVAELQLMRQHDSPQNSNPAPSTSQVRPLHALCSCAICSARFLAALIGEQSHHCNY